MTDLNDLLDKLSNDIKAKEAKWMADGYSMFEVWVDSGLGWGKYGKRHRIMYIDTPLNDLPVEKRMKMLSKIPQLETEIQYRVKEIQSELKILSDSSVGIA